MSEPPCGFKRLFQQCDAPELDIIAVHGIGAHRDWTWTSNGVNWLEALDMLPSAFPKARIVAYGYASSWLGKENMSTCLDGVAGRFLDHVAEIRRDCLARPVMFITHCFGGIVVEKAILKARFNDNDASRSLLSSISGLVLLGTPHRGSSAAGLASIVSAIAACIGCGQKSPILETVHKDSQMLADTVRQFAREAYRLNLRIHCFYEEKDTDIGTLVKSMIQPFSIASRTKLVDRDSACLQGYEDSALTTDHFKLNKFDEPHNANYILVRNTLQEMHKATAPPVDNVVLQCMEHIYVGDPDLQLSRIQQKWEVGISSPSHSWILSEERFCQWYECDEPRILWIHGGGTEQMTTLLSSLTQDAMFAGKALAYHFYDTGESDESIDVLRSLVWQLAYTRRPLGHHFKAYAGPGRRFTTDILRVPMLSSLLLRMLRDPDTPRTYIVLDRYVGTKDANEPLLRLIRDTSTDAFSNVKWIISSQTLGSYLDEEDSFIAVDMSHPGSFAVSPVPDLPPQQAVSSGKRYIYRLRGFPSPCDANRARELIDSVFEIGKGSYSTLDVRFVKARDYQDLSVAVVSTCEPPRCLETLGESAADHYQTDVLDCALVVDRHFHGCTQMYTNSPEAIIDADVVAIHDLTGHAYTSWVGSGEQRSMWLQQLLEVDFPHCRVMTYGYHPLGPNRCIQDLQSYCEDFLVELGKVRHTVEEKRRPLILIGHGFGGLIAAQALLQAKRYQRNPLNRDLFGSIKSFLFFALPTRGELIDEIQGLVPDGDWPPPLASVDVINDVLGKANDDLNLFPRATGRHLHILHVLPAHQVRAPESYPRSARAWSLSDRFYEQEQSLLDLPKHATTLSAFDADDPALPGFDGRSDPMYQEIFKFLAKVVAESIEARSPELVNSSLVSRTGLSVLHEIPDAVADIILIPGQDGDPWNTWSPDYRTQCHVATLGRFWPASALPRDFPTARIIVWGYACIADDEGAMLEDRASELLSDLQMRRPMGRSLIFIAQSTGGLLLKEVLRLANRGDSMATKDVMSYTSSTIFLGTPHGGDGDALSFEDVAKLATKGYWKCRTLLNQLEPGKDHFLEQYKAYDVRVTCFVQDPPSLPSARGKQTDYIVAKPAAMIDEISKSGNIATDLTGFCRFDDARNSTATAYGQIAAELRASLATIESKSLNLRDLCLASLYFKQLQERETNITVALDRTATWLFTHQEYTAWADWKHARSSTQRGLLWIRGNPGSGKSTLMKQVLAHTKSIGLRESFSVAGFFFTMRSNVRLQKSPLGLFRTILHDLLQQDKALLAAFITEFKAKRATSSSPWEWHHTELQSFFKSAYSGGIPHLRQAMIFIDALDESDAEGEHAAFEVARDLVYLFRDITAQNKLKVCLSSRHYPHIEVPDCPQISVERFNNKDIIRFVTSKLCRARDDTSVRELAKDIANRAQGVFLWVDLVVGTLNLSLHNRMRISDLKKTLSTLPPRLDDLYRGQFAEMSGKPEMEVALSIFQWVLLAKRPLAVDELRHVLTIDRTDETKKDDIMAWKKSEDCLPEDPEQFLVSLRFYTRGLAEIVVPVRCSPVQFIHESVREFFLRRQGFVILESQQNEKSLSTRHNELANFCMASLYQHGPSDDLVSPVLRSVNRYPFLRYAGEALFYHMSETEREGT
ncbi:hypothetical protein FB567DRAFT_496628, partial [Paraphoma chrysanthemicola]